MKTGIKLLLAASVLLLTYFCYVSIMTPIKFEEEKAVREREVVKVLVQIRDAQEEYKKANGVYAPNFDKLIDFVKTAKIKRVKKVGTLNEDQLKAGLTDAKALAIVKSKNAKEIAANGLQNFSRDTVFAPVIEVLFKDVYTEATINNIRYIPFSNKQEFKIATEMHFNPKTLREIQLLEVSAPIQTYLGDMNKAELDNIIATTKQLNEQAAKTGLAVKYIGLKIGDLETPNNNAGNWEF